MAVKLVPLMLLMWFVAGGLPPLVSLPIVAFLGSLMVYILLTNARRYGKL